MAFESWSILMWTVSLLALVYYYFWNINQYFKRLNITFAKPQIVTGSSWKAFTMQQNVKDTLNDIYVQFPNERYVGIFNFIKPSVMLKDPEILRNVLIKDFDHFTDRMMTVDEREPVLSKILFLMRGEAWKELRTTLTPTFTSSKMRSMIPFMQECADNMVDYLNSETDPFRNEDMKYIELDMKGFYSKYANDVIASCAFGIKINSYKDEDNSFYARARELVDVSFLDTIMLALFRVFPSLSKVQSFFNMKFGTEDIENFFRNVFKNNLNYRESNNIVREDMIHLLLLAKREQLSESNMQQTKENKPSLLDWTDDLILAQAVTFIFAGFETVSSTLSFLSYELAKNPHVQQKLQAEIDAYMLQSKETKNFEDTKKLKYLDMVITEVLRIHPITMLLERVCVKPYELPPQNDIKKTSLKLRVGDHIAIPICSLHRDPTYFPDPDKFYPERFSEENKSSITPFTYMPFGLGPRTCIAMRLAMLEMKIVIMTLLSQYDLLPCKRTPEQLNMKPDLLRLIPEEENWIRLKHRTQKL